MAGDENQTLGRVGSLSNRNLLCVFQNLESEPHPPAVSQHFELFGYDLVDVEGIASQLTNCGGFPLAFDNAEVTNQGLLR